MRQELNSLLSLRDGQVEALRKEALRRFGGEESIRAKKLQWEQAEAWLLIIDKLAGKLYLDNAEGRLEDDRLHRMVTAPEWESSGLKATLSELSALHPAQEPEARYQHLFALAWQYTHIKELDREALLTFAERIGAGPKAFPAGTVKATHRNQSHRQGIRIFYRFIGEMAEEAVRALPRR